MSSTTKKLPVAIALPSGRSGGSDFLVPLYSARGSARLVGIGTGRPAAQGLLVYTGASVTALDLLERMEPQVRTSSTESEWLSVLDHYIAALQDFRIGNVVKLSHASLEGVELVKILERPPMLQPTPKLPG